VCWIVGMSTCRAALAQMSHSFPVRPGHPVRGRGSRGFVVALQGDLVVEGALAVELGGIDQAHEDVSDVGAMLCLVEERALATAASRVNAAQAPKPSMCWADADEASDTCAVRGPTGVRGGSTCTTCTTYVPTNSDHG
jgi:hypothetical protein